MNKFQLPELPYAKDALSPYISKETIEYHYGKHHQAYVDNLNKLIVGTKFESTPIEQIIKNSSGAIFNNAAQFYNHNIYWNCFSPNGGGAPTNSLAKKINLHFGSFDRFQAQFTDACLALFGSGWVWLAQTADGKLEILATKNADNPLRIGKNPLLACDVWEHAYYIDRRNNRLAYVENFWKVIDWKKIEDNYQSIFSPSL